MSCKRCNLFIVVIALSTLAVPPKAQEETPQILAKKACVAAHALDPKAIDDAGGVIGVDAYCDASKYDADEWNCVAKGLGQKKGMSISKHKCGVVDPPFYRR